MLAQAKFGQPRASAVLRARVKENVLRATAAAPASMLGEDAPLTAAGAASDVAGAAALVKSTFAGWPVWVLPSLGVLAVVGGVASFAALRSDGDQAPEVVGPSGAWVERGDGARSSQPSAADGEVLGGGVSRRRQSSPAADEVAAGGEGHASQPRRSSAEETSLDRAADDESPVRRPSVAMDEASGSRHAGADESQALQPSAAVDRASAGESNARRAIAVVGEAASDPRAGRHASQTRQSSAAVGVGSGDERVAAAAPGHPVNADLKARRASPRSGEARVAAAAPGDADLKARRASQRKSARSGEARVAGAASGRASDAGRKAQRESSGPLRDASTDLRAEMQLLAQAEAALRKNEPLAALSVLDAHARRFSSGQLKGERDGLRLIAQCALGRDPESALARYLREHGAGVLQARIRASCARFLP